MEEVEVEEVEEGEEAVVVHVAQQTAWIGGDTYHTHTYTHTCIYSVRLLSMV